MKSFLSYSLKELYGDCEVIPHESSIASGFSNETFVFDVKVKMSRKVLF